MREALWLHQIVFLERYSAPRENRKNPGARQNILFSKSNRAETFPPQAS